MANNHELEMMTDMSESLLTPVGIQKNPILTGTPRTNSHVDTTNPSSVHINPPVMETKPSQNRI